MNFKINWSKTFLDFYPHEIVKQFTKISLPLYLGFSLVFLYIIMNFKFLFLSKNISLETVVAFYFILPILFPLTLIGLLLSSIHILRHNNPFYLFYFNFKHLLLYGFNAGMIVFSLLFLFVYGVIINQVFKIV